MKFSKILPCIITVLIMITIFMFSAQNAKESRKLSDGIIIQTVRKITGNKSADVEPTVKKYSESVRSAAHYLLYLALGISLFWALVENLNNKSLINLFIYTLLICLFYSISDEIHQIFVAGRACQLIDVFTDFVGSLCGSALLYYYIRKRIRKELT